jgi:hypothetical protein
MEDERAFRKIEMVDPSDSVILKNLRKQEGQLIEDLLT